MAKKRRQGELKDRPEEDTKKDGRGGREGVSGEGRALQNPRTGERTPALRERGGHGCPPGAERARLRRSESTSQKRTSRGGGGQ